MGENHKQQKSLTIYMITFFGLLAVVCFVLLYQVKTPHYNFIKKNTPSVEGSIIFDELFN
jgi:uncharacterized membrane protein YadS